MTEELSAFHAVATRLRDWVRSAYPTGDLPTNWEEGFLGWNDLYKTFTAVMRNTSREEWDEDTVDLMLFAIGCDNEAEWLADELAVHPAAMLHLAEQAIDFPEWEAKWQITYELSLADVPLEQAESLLQRFARDEHEYVRRRAMLALAYIHSPQVEELVGPAWDSGEEYQRIAVLCALDIIDSPRLMEYAERAAADGRESLAKYAAAIQKDGTLRNFTIQGIPVV